MHAETFIDNARVRSVEPQYENVSCPAQGVQRAAGSTKCAAPAAGQQYGGAVIGGVAGALLGNQVGRGHGREAATAVGAVVGAFTGDRLANGDRRRSSTKRFRAR